MNYIYANLGTAMDVINTQGDSTNVNLKKQSIKTQPASGHLVLFVPSSTGWKEKVFDASKQRIIISENSSDSDLPPNIFPPFRGSIVFQKCDDKWIILNSGRANSNFFFNGQSQNHMMIAQGEKAFVASEKNQILFIVIYLNSEGKVKKSQHNGEAGAGEFSIRLEKSNSEISFPEDSICFLGQNPYCDLPVGETDFIATIYKKNREYYITPLISKAPILVNTTPLMETRVLLRGSTISVGSTPMIFNTSDDAQNSEIKISTGADKLHAERLVLIPATRNSDGTRKGMLYIPSPGKSIFVGRDASQAHLVVNSKTVSKKHAQIISYDKCIMLLDCYSTNGTFVNGERISKRTVHPGDIIDFGEEKFILSYV